MILFFVLFALSAVLFFLAYNFLSTFYAEKQKTMEKVFQDTMDQLHRLEAEHKKLKAELSSLEKQASFMKHEISQSPAMSAAIMDLPEHKEDINEHYENHLLSERIITLEQSEKAKTMMDKLQMDFLSTCLTMGFIDCTKAALVKKQVL